MSNLFLATGAASLQRCDGCDATWPELSTATTCPDCGGLLAVVHGAPAEMGQALRQILDTTDRTSGVWRFSALVMPANDKVVSWPEGNTPAITRAAVSTYAGVNNLVLKHEGMNPTGSFKDRGMTVAVTHAVRAGATAVACASTGNTSASLAAYASQAGLPALVFVPKGKVSTGKLAQAMAYGARTLIVDGDFDACLALAREVGSELGVYLANSVNPWRLEGQKTIVWELMAEVGWTAPDWIALPAGAVGNTSAFGKALREAKALGLIDQVPRILAVQASGAAPFAQGFENGFAERVKVHAETVATAIRIGDPASWDRAVRAIRETNGVVVSVTDAEIMEAKAVIDASGVGCEPASAASVAGVKVLRARGVIGTDDRVACILTGHLLKDPDATHTFHTGQNRLANAPVAIEPKVSEVERVLKALRSR